MFTLGRTYLVAQLPAVTDKKFIIEGENSFSEKEMSSARWMDTPAFGFHYTNIFLKLKKRLPHEARQYKYISTYYECERYGYFSEPLRDAKYWSTPEGNFRGLFIKALLLTRDATIESVSEFANVPISSVATYEQLFFDVLDRKKERDMPYIFNIVNPGLVRRTKSCIDNESFESVVLMAGLKGTMKDVAHYYEWPGMLEHKPDDAIEVEGRFMAEANLLIRTTGLPKDHTTVTSSRNIISSAKQGGKDTGPNTIDKFGPTSSAINLTNMVRELQIADEETIEIEPPAKKIKS